MLKFIKTFFIALFIVTFSFHVCFAIDESELYGNTSNDNTQSYENQISASESNTTNLTNENTYGESYGSETDTSFDNTNTSADDLTDSNTSVETTTTQSTSEPSTTVSSISNVSDTSTFSNILSLGLIVVGILLILLGIAILIRLHR